MTNYDFHTPINREQTNSVKWGLRKDLFGSDEVLPMWVADMEFMPPNEVIEALEKRVQHRIYGYTYASASTTNAITEWQKKRHNWEVSKNAVLFSLGVVPSIAAAILAFTEKGDKVMLQSPVYTPFFSMIEGNERVVVNSPLILKDDQYEIDFVDFEERLKEGVKLFLLCNPHNPGGRVWTKYELKKIGDLCCQYNCYILSDEIHADLVYTPHQHLPIASLDQRFKEITITCIAPTKTFNLAGLQASAVLIENEQLRKRFSDLQAKQGFFTLSTFGLTGMEAAYRFGDTWLNELLHYLEENRRISIQFIEENLPEIKAIEPEGTYLLWLDCRKLELSDDEIQERLLKKGKVALEPGNKYGPGGEGFVRLNFACSQTVLLDGLNRVKHAFS